MAGCSRGAGLMAETIVGIFWMAWTVYLAAQGIRQKQREPRIGYLLSSCLTGYTAYLLLN